MRLRTNKRRVYYGRMTLFPYERLRSPLLDATMRLYVYMRTRYNTLTPTHLRFFACVRLVTETAT